MTLNRLRNRHLAAWATVVFLAACASLLHAQVPPSGERPLRMVIAFATGGSADTVGRLVADGLAPRLGRPVIPDNRPGATGTLGTGIVAKAEPDGDTILMATSSSHYSAYLYRNVSYDLTRDLTPVAGLAVVPLLVVARPDLPVKNMAELVTLAKREPGKLPYATPGSGGLAHLATEMFMRATGITMLHVPYKGVAAGVTDVMGGRVDVMFASVSPSGPHVRAGKLKALGITSATRPGAMPEVPAVNESVPGFEATYWLAIFAPAAVPADKVKRLNTEINGVMNGDAMKQRITDMGGVLRTGSPADFTAYLAADSAKWIRVIQETGAKVD